MYILVVNPAFNSYLDLVLDNFRFDMRIDLNSNYRTQTTLGETFDWKASRRWVILYCNILLGVHFFLLAIEPNEILVKLRFPMVLEFLGPSSVFLKIFLQRRNFMTYTFEKFYLVDCLGIPAMNFINLEIEARLDAFAEKTKRETAALTIALDTFIR